MTRAFRQRMYPDSPVSYLNDFPFGVQWGKALLINEDSPSPSRRTRSILELYETSTLAFMSPEEPASFKEAKDKKEWNDAMKEEKMCIEKNDRWELGNRPTSIKLIANLNSCSKIQINS